MKNLFLTAVIALIIFVCTTSCEADNDLPETETITKEENPVTQKIDLSADGYVNYANSTNLTTLWMRDDHEPRSRGNAEMYAHIIGLDSNKQPIITTVRMPYANHDRTMYYPNQKMIDWDKNNYAGGLVSIVFMEADNPGLGGDPIFPTTYNEGQFFNMPIPQALNIITNDFVSAVGTGYSTISNGIIFDGADDLLDVFYNISRTRDYVVVGGAVGGSRNNVYVTLKRKFD